MHHSMSRSSRNYSVAEKHTDFFIQAAALDKYIHLDNPKSDPIGRRVVIKRLRESPELYQYFFAQGPTPGWAEVLLEEGFFGNPPDVIREDAGFRTPPWPPSAYLAAVAGSVPRVVSTVVGQIDTDNPLVHIDLVRAVSKIPTEDAILHISKVKLWLNGKFNMFWWGLPEAVSQLIVSFAEKGRVKESIDLLNEVIRPVVIPISKTGDFTLGAIAKSRFELSYLRPDLWQEVLPRLEQIAHLDVIDILQENLRLAIRLELEAEGHEDQLLHWRSHEWRSSIGDSSQNLGSYYKDRLLVALRDSLERLVDRQPTEARGVLVSYLIADVPLQRRIGIYILSVRPDVYPDLIASLLQDASLHRDIHVHNEYFALLQAGFRTLPVDVKERVVAFIIDGPDPNDTRKLADWVAVQYGEQADEYAQRHKDTWTRDRLWKLQPHLGHDIQSYLNQLCEQYGEPEHPEFLSWFTGVHTVSEESPLSIDTLAAMSPEQLVELISGWQPDADQRFGPTQITLRGLATAAATVILGNPAKYDVVIPTFAAVHPTYAGTIFHVAEEAWINGKDVPWQLLLRLGHEVVASANNVQANVERNFEARIGMLRLIEHGLNVKRPMPLDQLDEVESVLLVSLNDPNPDIKDDEPQEGWLGHGDPATLAENTVRPKALICIMELLRLRSHFVKQEGASSKEVSRAQLLTPRLQEALLSKLDKSLDPSWTVHSVFGRYVGLMGYISPQWLQERLKQIFPSGDDPVSQRYFMAAWDSYVVFNNPSRWLIESLRADYIRAIHFLAEGKVTKTHLDPQSGLAYHILMDYLWQPYDLTKSNDRNLIGLLFSICNDEIRGRTAWVLWRLVHGVPQEDRPMKWPAMKAIWQWRTNEASLGNYPIEFVPEMEWFARFPVLAPDSETFDNMYSLLEALIPYVHVWNIWRALEEFLASRVKKSPREVIRYYRLMHEQETEMKYGYPASENEADLILSTAMEDDSSRRDAVAVLDLVGRRTGGRTGRYRELYERYMS